VMFTLMLLSVPAPVFVSVTDCAALILPTPWLANVRLVGASVTVVVLEAPVPVRLTN
jgi:hypothetical protein